MITLLTLNTWLLDIRVGRLPLFRPAPYLRERLAALPGAIREIGADVVCLQEVYRMTHRRFLARRLADIYPFHAGLNHPGLPVGTGLMVLSRHPIEAARPIEFAASLIEERLVVRLGLLDSILSLPGLGRCRVVNLHTTAGGLFRHPEGAGAQACRSSQIGEALRAADGAGPGTVVLAGDLNAGPHSSTGNYREVLAAGYADAFAAAAPGGPRDRTVTWDPGNAALARWPARGMVAQRIDHVFVRWGEAAGWRVGAARVVLDEARVAGAGGERIPVSDHYGVLVRLERDG